MNPRKKPTAARFAKPLAWVAGGMILLSQPCLAQAAGSFSGLGSLPGDNSSQAWGVSADGSVVVGGSGSSSTGTGEAFRWTQAGGMAGLGFLPGGSDSAALDVSADGSVVVGWSDNGTVNDEAFRWTQAGGMAGLGFLPGGSESVAFGVSADGSVVVGWSGSRTVEAFRWTQAGGMAGLGFLPGGNDSEAWGASADGTVVVGLGYNGANAEAFRWTQAGGMTGLGFLPGDSDSMATRVSADGTVVVGASGSGGLTGTDAAFPINMEAFRWTQAGGMAGLGFLPGGSDSLALGMSADGSVVVGASGSASGSASNTTGLLVNPKAFRWAQAKGMQSVAAWLSGAGVTMPAHWQLQYASGVSADGSVVVGIGADPNGNTQAWLARVSPLGSGLLAPSVYDPTLAEVSGVPQAGISLDELALFGAHHRPLLDSGLSGGTGCYWATGDVSRHDSTHTDQYLAEVGACRDLVPHSVRVGVGIGHSSSRQDLAYGGTSRYDGQYLIAEADYAPTGGAWIASLTGLYGEGSSDIRRGYPNGGGQDISSGHPDASSWALRARFDWRNAAHLGAASLSPFVAYTHTESHLDGYTESGGGFPARFDAQNQTAREARLGAVLKTALSAATDLRLTLEDVNRLGSNGSPTVTGQVLGLYAFALAGASTENNWGRVGVDVDHRFGGKSLITASLDAASSGGDPNVSASIGWKRAF